VPNPSNRKVFRNLQNFDEDEVVENVECSSQAMDDWTVTWTPWGGKQEPKTTTYQAFRKRLSRIRKAP
jgi:hypothetical protein